MQNTFQRTGHIKDSISAISLNILADQVIIGLEPRCRQKRSFMANDIHPEIKVVTDTQILSSLIGSLLRDMLSFGYDNHIHISAKSFGYITLLHLRNNNNYENHIAPLLHQMQPMAEKLGGCLDITHNRLHGTTVALTFVNKANANTAKKES